MGGAACHPPFFVEPTLCGAAIPPVGGAVSLFPFFGSGSCWEVLLRPLPFLGGWCCFVTTLIGGAVFLPLAMGVLLPALGGAVSWDLAFGSSWWLAIVEGQGHREVPKPRASGVVGSWIVGSSFYQWNCVFCCLGLGAVIVFDHFAVGNLFGWCCFSLILLGGAVCCSSSPAGASSSFGWSCSVDRLLGRLGN